MERANRERERERKGQQFKSMEKAEAMLGRNPCPREKRESIVDSILYTVLLVHS